MNYTSSMQTNTNGRSLPKGWKWVRLGNTCTILNGFAFDSEKYSTYGIPLIRIRDLKTNSPSIFFSEDYSKEYLIEPGSLLVGMDGEFRCYRWAGPISLLNQRVCKLTPNQELLDSDFLYYSLNEYLEEIEQRTSYTTVKHISSKQILDIQLKIPPLDEQRRIANRLNEQLAAVESTRRAAEEQLQAARELPSAYLREIFDNHTTNKWSKVRLGDILYLRKEIIYPYDKPKGPAVFVGLEHIKSNTGVRIGSVDIEMSKLTGRKPKFYQGDIVYGYLRPYLNKVWIAEFDGLCSVDQYTYKVDDKMADTNFVAWFMRSPVYLERAPINTTPGQLPRIRTEEVASVEIDLPPLEEQKRISLQISEKLGAAKNMVDALESQMDEINQLPASLLREAFAGEV